MNKYNHPIYLLVNFNVNLLHLEIKDFLDKILSFIKILLAYIKKNSLIYNITSHDKQQVTCNIQQILHTTNTSLVIMEKVSFLDK